MPGASWSQYLYGKLPLIRRAFCALDDDCARNTVADSSLRIKRVDLSITKYVHSLKRICTLNNATPCSVQNALPNASPSLRLAALLDSKVVPTLPHPHALNLILHSKHPVIPLGATPCAEHDTSPLGP